MTLSDPLTVIGMVNGMIGGFILILPVNGLHAGLVFTLLVIIIIGAFSYYSCYLCVIHLGDQKDLDHAMFNHFNKSYVIKIIYDLTVFSNLLFLGFLYFDLICIQWQGITGSGSIAIPLANTAVLFILIFVLKYFEFGASIMAYGIISIVGYVIFLMWVMASRPSGPNTWEPFGSGQVNLAAAMGGAYSIQTFFIPVLKKNPNQHKYVFFTFLANLIGGCVYMYIALMGGFGILNRKPHNNPAQDIEDYFPTGTVQVIIIEALYLVHLYSVFPQFTLISKETEKGKIPIPQIIYGILFVGLCLLMHLLKVKINTLVDVNGSVIGFFFIYFLPALLHIKCRYFSKNKITMEEKMRLLGLADLGKAKVFETQMAESSRTNRTNQDRQNQIDQNDTQKQVVKRQTQFSDPYYLNNSRKFQKSSIFQDIQTNRTYYNVVTNPNNKTNEQNTINNDNKNDPLLLQIDSNSQDKQKQNQKQDQNQKDQLMLEQLTIQGHFVCDCKRPTNISLQILQMIVLIIMMGLGAFILVNGIMTVSED